MMELTLDCAQVFEDIRVVEFEVVQNRGAGPVMHELGALVEKGAVVFICLDHEERRIAEPGRDAEVLRYAADQETGSHAGVFENPCQQTRCGGLAVGSGNGHDPTVLQHMTGQPLGAGHIGNALVQHVFHCGVATGQGVADDHQIGGRVQMGRVVAFHQLDTLGLQLGAHGWVDVGIGAADLMPEIPRQQCQRAHERTADTENVQMHRAALLNKDSRGGY